MSEDLENINIPEADIGSGTPTWLYPHRSHPLPPGDGQYPPRSPQNQAPKIESGFIDSSGPIFSMYLGMAEEEDEKMAESWKADAEGILVFVRLYLLVLCFTPSHLS
jgi:hypothetical protein